MCARVRGLARNGSKEVCVCICVCLRVNKRQGEHFCFSIKTLPHQGLIHGAFLFPLILSNSSIIRTWIDIIRKSPCNVFISLQILWHPTTSCLLPNTELFLHSKNKLFKMSSVWDKDYQKHLDWLRTEFMNRKKNLWSTKKYDAILLLNSLSQGPLTTWDRFNLKSTSYILFVLWGYKWNSATIPFTFLSARNLKNWVEKIWASVSS